MLNNKEENSMDTFQQDWRKMIFEMRLLFGGCMKQEEKNALYLCLGAQVAAYRSLSCLGRGFINSDFAQESDISLLLQIGESFEEEILHKHYGTSLSTLIFAKEMTNYPFAQQWTNGEYDKNALQVYLQNEWEKLVFVPPLAIRSIAILLSNTVKQKEEATSPEERDIFNNILAKRRKEKQEYYRYISVKTQFFKMIYEVTGKGFFDANQIVSEEDVRNNIVVLAIGKDFERKYLKIRENAPLEQRIFYNYPIFIEKVTEEFYSETKKLLTILSMQ